MLPVVGLSLLLVYVVCRRLGMARWAAGSALLAFGLSPLSVTMMRQIYLDSFAVMWILAALALALSPRRHLWHHVGAGVAAGLAVLSKETIAHRPARGGHRAVAEHEEDRRQAVGRQRVRQRTRC